MTRAGRTRPGRPRGTVSLERALSKLGFASRTIARGLIEGGRVRVDGRTISDPTRPVTPEHVHVEIDGLTPAPLSKRLLAFHKPRGVVTTRSDPEGRRTVFDVLGAAATGLVAVGRLDLASTGLLLLTSDTQLAHRLTDPANRIPRRYVVTVRGRLAQESLQKLTGGLASPDARGRLERLSAASVTIRKASGRETHLMVELVEGRNRELRRMFSAIGHEATRVHRVAFGRIELGDLQPGEWREIPVDDA